MAERKKTTTRKPAAKKPAAKKPAARKPAAKKPAASKPASKTPAAPVRTSFAGTPIPEDTPALGNRVATFSLVSVVFSFFFPLWAIVNLFVCWPSVRRAKKEGLKLDKRVYVSWVISIVFVVAIVLIATGIAAGYVTDTITTDNNLEINSIEIE